MSIKPIDLQTLFSQINHVGKDQAFQKEAVIMQQATVGKELAEKTLQSDETVNQTSASSEGPNQVHDDQEGNQQGNSSKQQKQENEKKKKEVFSDPDLGTHIDIEG